LRYDGDVGLDDGFRQLIGLVAVRQPDVEGGGIDPADYSIECMVDLSGESHHHVSMNPSGCGCHGVDFAVDQFPAFLTQ